MDIQLIVRGVPEDGELRAFFEERFDRVVSRFEDRIQNAVVRLEDVTGPEKHGVDKLCSIELKLKTGEIRIKEQGEEFHPTISKALDRVRAALSREVSRAKHGIGEG